MHPWPAPSVHSSNPRDFRAGMDVRAVKRGRQSRTASAAAKPVRQHGSRVSGEWIGPEDFGYWSKSPLSA